MQCNNRLEENRFRGTDPYRSNCFKYTLRHACSGCLDSAGYQHAFHKSPVEGGSRFNKRYHISAMSRIMRLYDAGRRIAGSVVGHSLLPRIPLFRIR